MKAPPATESDSELISGPWHVEEPELAAELAKELGKEKQQVESEGGVMSLPGWVARFGIEP